MSALLASQEDEDALAEMTPEREQPRPQVQAPGQGVVGIMGRSGVAESFFRSMRGIETVPQTMLQNYYGGLEAGVIGVRRVVQVLDQIARGPRLVTPSPLGITGTVGQELINEPFRQSEFDKWLEQQQSLLAESRRRNTVDPATRGEAANIIAGLAGLMTSAAVGGRVFGPLTMGGAGALDAYDRLVAEGVDPETAAEAAKMEGVVLALMGVAPVSAQGGLITRAATGAGLNVPLGMGQRYSVGEYLRSQGYEDQAKQYDWMDPASITIDAVLGAFFGGAFGARGIRREGEPPPTSAPSPIDPDLAAAALVEQDTIHRTITTAPGIPLNGAAHRAHAQALRAAEEQAANDLPIDVAYIFNELRAPPPPLPPSLNRFLARGGGLRDDGGEVSNAIGAERGRQLERLVGEAGSPEALAARSAAFAPHMPRNEDDFTLAVEEMAREMEAQGYREMAEELRAARDAGIHIGDADDALMFSRGERVDDEWTQRVAREAEQLSAGPDDPYRAYQFERPDGRGIIRYQKQGDAYAIGYSELHPDIRGQRQGVALYESFIRQAQADGKRFVRSDAHVSPEAQRVYEALERRGYDIERGRGGGDPAFTIKLHPEMFSRGARAPGASPEAIAQALRSSFGRDAQTLLDTGKTEIVATVEEARARLGYPLPAETKGVYDPRTGKSYIIAERVSEKEAARILLHEVGVHTGMRDLLGPKLYRKLEGEVSALVDGGNPLALEVHKRIEQLVAEGKMRRSDAPEETLAYLVEGIPELEATRDLPLVRRLLAQVRMWLWRTFDGAEWIGRLSVEDIRSLAVTSLRRVAKQAERETRGGVEIIGDPAATRGAEVLASAGREGYEGTDTGEAVEWLRAKAKGLPMDEASRMARAREMGFDVDTPLYRGSTRDEVSLEARADGHKPVGPAVHLSPRPQVASQYAEPRIGDVDAAANVAPYYARGPLATMEQFREAQRRVQVPFARGSDSLERQNQLRAQALEAAAGDLQRRGYTGVRGQIAGLPFGSDEVAVFDPRNIRSRFAAFDPDYSESANLLASNPQGAELDAMGFRSVALEAAQALPSRKMKGEEAVNRILKARGVEGFTGRVQDEVDYLGLREEFGSRKSVSREEIIDYIRINRLVLEEAFNRFDPKVPGSFAPRADAWEYVQPAPAPLDDMFRAQLPGTTTYRDFNTFAEAEAYVQRMLGALDPNTTNTPTSASIRRGPGDLRLPGDEPVFELRIKIPEGLPGSDFESHWSRPPSNDKGVLVSIRGEERIDDEGKRTLFGGEVQSDLAQSARAFKDRVAEAKKNLADAEAQLADAGGILPADLFEAWDNLHRRKVEFPEELSAGKSEDQKFDELQRYRAMRRVEASREHLQNVEAGGKGQADAPLASKTSAWTGAAVRALVYRAARDGFESVSFPTGETSALIQGNDSAAAHYDTNVRGAAQKIARAFGVELRDGTVEYEQDAASFRWEAYDADGELQGYGLTEERARELLDGGPGEVKRRGGEPNQASAYVLPITEEMRARILKEGLPLFSRGWDDSAPSDKRSHSRGIGRRDPPAGIPDPDTPEYAALLEEARNTPANRRTREMRAILEWEKEQPKFSFGGREPPGFEDAVASFRLNEWARREAANEQTSAYEDATMRQSQEAFAEKYSDFGTVSWTVRNALGDAKGDRELAAQLLREEIEWLKSRSTYRHEWTRSHEFAKERVAIAEAALKIVEGGNLRVVANNPQPTPALKAGLLQWLARKLGLNRGDTDARPPESGSPKFSLGARDPDPVKQAIADDPEMEIPSRAGKSERASDAIESADEQVKSAREEAKGYDAAASCAAQHGMDKP